MVGSSCMRSPCATLPCGNRREATEYARVLDRLGRIDLQNGFARRPQGREGRRSGRSAAEALLAGAHAERLEQVALAGAGIAGDDEVVVAADEFEVRNLADDGLVERGLKSKSNASSVFGRTTAICSALSRFFSACSLSTASSVIRAQSMGGNWYWPRALPTMRRNNPT
jgi:hypothetical protein